MQKKELIDKYVTAHSDMRWMDAGELESLLTEFAGELFKDALEAEVYGGQLIMRDWMPHNLNDGDIVKVIIVEE